MTVNLMFCAHFNVKVELDMKDEIFYIKIYLPFFRNLFLQLHVFGQYLSVF